MKKKLLKVIILFCFLAFSHLYTQGQSLLTGLSACYPLNCDGAADSSPNALNGTINGNVSCTTGHLGANNTAYQFGGAPTDYIELPNNPLLKPSTELTISGWFFVNTNSPAQVLIYSNNGCSGNFDAYSLVWDGPAKVFRGYKRPGPGSCASGTIVPSQTLTTGWHHVVWYLNNLVSSIIVDNGTPTTLSNPVVFNYDPNKGVILGGTNENTNLPFDGKMDNVRFWTRQLTTSEITDLYTNDPICTELNTTGIRNNINSLLDIDIYPNPSNGIVTIIATKTVNEKLSIKVLDVTGKIVYTKFVNSEDDMHIDITSLPDSFYLIEIQNETKQIFRKKIILN